MDTLIIDDKHDMPTGNQPRTTMFWMRGCGGDGTHGLFVLGCGATGQFWNWRVSTAGGGPCTRLHLDFHGADCEWGQNVPGCNEYADIRGASEEWQMLAVTYNGATLVGYLNGEEIARSNPTTPPST